jgi:single-strand DNA-binding protein
MRKNYITRNGADLVNRVVLVGRLTKDPELRGTTSGVSVCTFTVACDRAYVQNGERQADFISCIAYRKNAEFINQYFRKGYRIALDGSIRTRTWDDTSGNRHYATEVLVDRAEFAQSKNENNNTYSAPPTETNDDFDGFMPISDEDMPF